MRSGLKGIKPAKRHLANHAYEKAKLSFVNGAVGRPLKLHELHPIMRQGLDDNIATFAIESETFGYPLTIGQIKGMQVKTLLLKSDKSPRWFGYICAQLNRVLPNSELKTLNASTHWLHLDEADLFNSTVVNFIERNNGN